MTSQVFSRLRWNIYSIWGLRGLRKRWIWLIILNRITRKLDRKVLCMCGRYVAWMNVWSVCTSDAFLCNECMKDHEFDNESEYVEPIRGFQIIRRILS